MFGWRRKNDGFDWHTYIRTTVKVRRQARRDRIDAARQAALDKAHAAGHAVAEGGMAAGKAAIAGAQAGAVQGAQGAAWLGGNLWRATVIAFGPLLQGAIDGASRLAATVPWARMAGPAALLGTVALGTAAYGAWTGAAVAAILLPLLIGSALVIPAAPTLLRRQGATIPPVPARIALPAAIVALVGAGYALQSSATNTSAANPITALSRLAILPRGPAPIEGRASAIAGDIVRVDDRTIRLTGIEAPDRQQTCTGAGRKSWKCGEAARTALQTLVRGKRLTCTVAAKPDADGHLPGTCATDGRDIAAELVREGHVFAVSSLIGGHGAVEAEARQAKRGLWSGEAERPADYRAKIWEAARKAAPDGCPVKGTVTSAGKVYVLPGDERYRTATIRPTRGERWFCTEDEAATAGWRPARRG